MREADWSTRNMNVYSQIIVWSVIIPVQYIQLLRKMRMMMVKIDNFNQSGVMEGATAVKANHFTSMKQDVLDLCDSKYDAKIKKCCAEQPIEVLQL